MLSRSARDRWVENLSSLVGKLIPVGQRKCELFVSSFLCMYACVRICVRRFPLIPSFPNSYTTLLSTPTPHQSHLSPPPYHYLAPSPPPLAAHTPSSHHFPTTPSTTSLPNTCRPPSPPLPTTLTPHLFTLFKPLPISTLLYPKAPSRRSTEK